MPFGYSIFNKYEKLSLQLVERNVGLLTTVC